MELNHTPDSCPAAARLEARANSAQHDIERVLVSLEKLAGNGRKGEIQKLGETVHAFAVSTSAAIATLTAQQQQTQSRINVIQAQVWGLVMLILGAAAAVLKWG